MKRQLFKPCIIQSNRHYRDVYTKHHHYTFKEGEVVMHICDRNYCHEITHLTLGTSQDNVDDMTSKERQWSKLSSKDIEKIRDLKGKKTQQEIATLFGVSRSNVAMIQGGYSWKHLS